MARSPKVFLASAIGWNLGLFAAIRTPWIEHQVLIPLMQFFGC